MSPPRRALRPVVRAAWLAAAGLAAVLTGAPAAQVPTQDPPSETARARRAAVVELPGARPVALTIDLAAEHGAYLERLEGAARLALAQYAEWFGPFDRSRVLVTDRAFDAVPARPDEHVVSVRLRWLVWPRLLDAEAQVARGLARYWWGGVVRFAGPDGDAIAHGIVEYLQSRTIEVLYDERFDRVAYSAAEARFFGGFVPWAFRDVLASRHAEGLGRDAYVAEPGDVRARSALVIGTLERLLGWPALHRGLREVVTRASAGVVTPAAFFEILGRTAGRDLAWFSEPAYDPDARYDYAIEGVESAPADPARCGQAPCFVTTVTLVRRGAAVFAGTSRPPVGEYESGRALTVEVTFADGQRLLDPWDGRATRKRLEYLAPVPAAGARLDPERTLLLDRDYLDNGHALAAASPRMATKWAANWMVWFHHLLLTAAFFV